MIKTVHEGKHITVYSDGAADLHSSYSSMPLLSLTAMKNLRKELDEAIEEYEEFLKPKPGEFQPGDRFVADSPEDDDLKGLVVSVLISGEHLRGAIFDDRPTEILVEGHGWVPEFYIKDNS